MKEPIEDHRKFILGGPDSLDLSRFNGGTLEGLDVSLGQFGWRATIERPYIPAAVEFRDGEGLITVQYGQVVQADYNYDGRLISSGLWLGGLWAYLKASGQPVVYDMATFEETMQDFGMKNVLMSVDVPAGMEVKFTGLSLSDRLLPVKGEPLWGGEGSLGLPLAAFIGQRGVIVALAWSDEILRMGTGEGHRIMTMPIVRNVQTRPVLGNLTKRTLRCFVTEALPMIKLFEKEEG